MPEKLTKPQQAAAFAKRVLTLQAAEKSLPPEHLQAIREANGKGITRANEAGLADHYSPGGWHDPSVRGGLTAEMAGVNQEGQSVSREPAAPQTLNDTAEEAIRIAKAQRPGQSRMVNDVSEPVAEEYEMDDQGRVLSKSERGPMTWSNAGERIANSGGEWIRKNHPEWMQSDLQKDLNDAKVQKARNEVDMWAIPKATAMRQAFAPADIAGHYIMDPADKPKTRDPVQIQREFSNDDEKAAYLERSGRGMKGSKQ